MPGCGHSVGSRCDHSPSPPLKSITIVPDIGTITTDLAIFDCEEIDGAARSYRTHLRLVVAVSANAKF